MIKFFRKIRQQLLSENKFSKYFLYAVGEIVLVVLGILIALQLNQWKDNQKLDSIRKGYYEQVLVDLKKDRIYIKESIADMESIKTNYDEYLETFKEPNLTTLQMISNLFRLDHSAKVLGFNTSTVESLESTGDIKLVPLTIRNELIDLKRSQDLIIKYSFNNTKDQSRILQIFAVELGAYDLASRLTNQPKLAAILNIENNYPKVIMALEANMSWKISTMSIDALNEIFIENVALAELITAELEK